MAIQTRHELVTVIIDLPGTCRPSACVHLPARWWLGELAELAPMLPTGAAITAWLTYSDGDETVMTAKL